MPYNKEDPKRKEKQAAAAKRYREKNKDNPEYKNKKYISDKRYREKIKLDPIKNAESNKYKKDWAISNPDKVKLAIRKRDLWRKFKITIEEYVSLYEKQKGLCAICEEPEKENNKRLAVDHNHDTGKVRGLLCRACNTGIGLLKEKQELFEKAIKYLKQNTNDV